MNVIPSIYHETKDFLTYYKLDGDQQKKAWGNDEGWIFLPERICTFKFLKSAITESHFPWLLIFQFLLAIRYPVLLSC